MYREELVKDLLEVLNRHLKSFYGVVSTYDEENFCMKYISSEDFAFQITSKDTPMHLYLSNSKFAEKGEENRE